MPTRWYQRTDSAAAPRVRGWMIILAALALLLIGYFWGPGGSGRHRGARRRRRLA